MNYIFTFKADFFPLDGDVGEVLGSNVEMKVNHHLCVHSSRAGEGNTAK